MKRPVLLGAVLLGIAVVAALGGAYAYFFSGLRSTPRPLALSSATPAPSASAASSAAGDSGLVGSWTVAAGSQAGYRVSEQFVGQTSAHDAVARTSDVTGALTVQQGSSGLQASSIQFTAQLSGLRSVDTVAGRDVSQRDFFVSRTLSVSRYADATFKAQDVALPASLVSGGNASLTVPGELTIHGVTKAVQVDVQVRLTGSQAQAAGSTALVMTDYGITPPQVPFTTVRPQVTLEFQLTLSKG